MNITELFQVTNEAADLRFESVQHALGASAIAQGMDLHEIETDTVLNLPDDDYKRYMDLDINDLDLDNLEYPTWPTQDAEDDYHAKVSEQFGQIDGYELGFPEPGQLFLVRSIDDLETFSSTVYRLLAETNGVNEGAARVSKLVTVSTRVIGAKTETNSVDLKPTKRDHEILAEALVRLAAINQALATK